MGKGTKDLLNQIDSNIKLIMKNLNIQTSSPSNKAKEGSKKQGTSPIAAKTKPKAKAKKGK